MCEQTPMAYKQGDIVWVKLGPCWWPGEVVSFDELPSDVIESFKKPPLAVVKFFNEENYEFVRNLNNIYLYNSHKKYEFIKKGLDLHRAKHSFMEKFPSDVCAAEEKTDGNPNILNDPQLTPEKRTDYTDIFGLSSPKRGTKESPRFRSKHSFSRHSSSGGSPKKRSSLITHPRFLSKGKDDHEVRILIQVSDEAKPPQQEYTCHTCGFKSTRVDVIVLHNKSHITGVYTPVSISKKSKQQASPRRAKKVKKSPSPPKKPTTTTATAQEEEQRPVLTDFKSDLLAEWNDDEDEEEEEEEQSTNESSIINEPFSKKHHLEDELDDAKRKKAMKMSHSKTRTLEEDLALVEKGIPLCTESSSENESEDSLPKAKRKSPPSIIEETSSSESGAKKEQPKTLQSFLDFEKEIAKDNLIMYSSEKSRKQPSVVSDDSDYAPLKNKRKHVKTPVSKAKKSKVSVPVKAKSDFTSDLLAEWDDDDDEDEDEADLTENEDKSEQALGVLNKQNEEAASKNEVVNKEPPDGVGTGTGKKEKSSCFDFDEDEDTELLARSEEGRKIPRVIPPPASSNNKMPLNIELSDENLLDSIDEGMSSEKPEETDVAVDDDDDRSSKTPERLPTPEAADACNKVDDFNEETEAFNSILASTVVPKLPEIPRLLKCEQNFHSASTIKFPDKNANEDFDCDVPTPEGTVVTTIVEPNDKQEDIIEVVEESADAEEAKEETVEVALKEPEAELPVEIVDNSANINKEAEDEEEEEDETSKTETSSIDETPINKDSESSKDVDDTISEDSAPPPLGSPLTPPPARSCSPSPKPEVSFDFQKAIQAEAPKQTEVATKLTNPKKRFVKTFEDETKNLSEKSSQEEQVPDEMKNVKVSKLKTLLMSKININSYRKKGFDYERITSHKSRGSRSKLDDMFLGSEKAVESHPPVLEELLGERSLDLTAKEEARVLVSCPQEKIEETIPSPLPTKEGDDSVAEEEITEFVGDDNKLQEVASAEDKNDSMEEDKMEAENVVDLQENKKQEDALLESAAASSDSELKIVEEQIQVEDTIVEENRPEEKAESVLPSTSEVMIQECEALPEEPVDLNNPPTDEKAALNNLVNDDSVSEMEDPKPPIIESGNLTIVHEEDLVDKQVEITNQAEQKPVTLSNFSMDYCEDNTSDNHRHQNVTIVEKVVPEEKVQQSNKVQVDYGLVQDVEEKISSFEINKQFKPEKVVSEEEDVEDEEGAVVENEGVKKEEKVLDPPFVEKETSLETEMAKITDASNDSSVLVEHVEESTSSTKLLEILTDVTPKPEKVKPSIPPPSVLISSKSIAKDKMKILNRIETKSAKFIGKSAIAGTSKIGGSAKVITEKVIKPVESETLVSVKKVSSKRSYQDVEDIDAFIIQKPLKKLAVASDSNLQESVQIAPTPKGKARILQQTIITPAGDIIQPIVSSQSQNDDNNMFDINSMPIVLDDQILTPESIENMPIVLQESPPPPPPPPTIPTPAKSNPVKKISSQQVKLLNKTIAAAPPKETTVVKTQPSLIKQYSKPTRVHKVYQTGSSKLLKHNPAVITQTGKPGKFIIVPSTAAPTGNKYTVGKRPPIIKRSTSSVNVSTPSITKVQNIAPEPTGNKIMIVTNNLGQQQRVLLTPVQQKMLAYPSPSSKLKPVVKNSGGIQHKAIAIKESSPAATKLAGSKTPSQVFSPITTTQQLKSVKVDPSKMKKVPLQNQKLYLPVNKPSTSGRTIIIKNPQGQTVKRIQSSDDSLMEQQVAEQIQAINRASTKPLLKELPITKTRTPVKKSYAKKPIGDSSRILSQSKSHVPTLVATSSSSSMNKTSSLPPLAPISMQKKLDVVSVSHPSQSQAVSEVSETTQPVQVSEDKSEETKRLPHQLVIQDAHGNQTTITEGQILALPSEAIDGQPQSYVLVTLDETGNLAPLNNEALMSLDPNLSLGGDLGNMVLQIDQGASSESEPASEVIPPPPPPPPSNQEVAATNPVNVLPKTVEPPQEPLAESAAQDSNLDSNSLQAVAINSGDTGQQLIITGDPISTQKFLESLTDGNADLANLLANTKGNILIQAEGQQILINTDTENQMLLTVNPENLGNVENTEGNGNPIFATQPMKNQDILAAALADTDVFQQDQSISHSPSKVIQSQLSPNSTLYPIHAGNVLETSSMSSPIMTPLEVPSTNNKKIDDEADILSQVPKNVDLPITITDPNISQTVAQQQVVSLMAAELPSTLDLPPLTIQDPSMSVTSSEMNSPSFVYSLPVLDDAVDMNQKAFSTSISMPLLTEDPEDALVVEATADADSKIAAEAAELSLKQTETGNKSPKEMELSAIRDDKTDLKDNFMDAEGLCTMRGGICNSLSEPPPDMFDFSVGTQNYESSSEVKSNSTDIDNIPTESPSTTPITTRQDEEDSGSDKSKLDVDSDLKLEESKPMDVMYSVGSNLEMRSHTPSTNTDDSCEIPVQPEIVTDLTLKNFHNDSGMTDSNFESNGSSLNDESDI